MSRSRFPLAVCQLRTETDYDATLEKTAGMIHDAAASGAAVVVLPEMFSCPIASMIVATALEIRLPKFAIAVSMPPVAARACSSKDLRPSSPWSLSFKSALLKSSKDSVPFCKAA